MEGPLGRGRGHGERLHELRGLVADGGHDPEAHLRLATLLDAEERTLPVAARHYATAIRQFVLDGALERVCAAYDAFCEGGHPFEHLDPEVGGAVAAAYEKSGRKDAALYVYHHLATQPTASPRLAEQALVRTASIALELGDLPRAGWALERLGEEFPFSAWTEWAQRQRSVLRGSPPPPPPGSPRTGRSPGA